VPAKMRYCRFFIAGRLDLGSFALHSTPRKQPWMRVARLCISFHCRLAAILLAVSALGTATPVNSQTTRKSPAKQQLASPIQELQKRMEAQRSAATSGDPSAVESSSRQVAALALQQMAALRSVEHAWRQAAELYRQSLALEENPETRLAGATAALYAGDIDQALTELDRLLAADARNSQAWYLKGKVLTARQDYRGAAQAFTSSLGIKRNVNVQFALGRALARFGK